MASMKVVKGYQTVSGALERAVFSLSCEKQATTADRQTAAPPITLASLPTVALNGHMQALGSLKLCPAGLGDQNGFQVGRSVNLRYPRLAPNRRPSPERIGTTAIWPSPDVSAVMPRPPMK